MTYRGRRIGRWAALLLLTTSGCVANKEAQQQVGPQGWTDAQRADWYGAAQGSRLMPYEWFKALEIAEGTERFAAPKMLARFGFLPRADQPLPVGFGPDDQSDNDMTVTRLRWYVGQQANEKWVGLNCSACHTAEMRFGSAAPIRVDGGPSLIDFQSFIDEADEALRATRANPDKWDRFAKRVLVGRDNPANRKQLMESFATFLAWQQRVAALDATTQRYGYGRLDAVGRIFNKVALYTKAPNPILNEPDAPVSYPFLWDIWRQDRLQWNGIAQSARLKLGNGNFLDYGALGRNAGEVIGVFGDVDTTPRGLLAGFHSSVLADNLDRIEHQLRQLRAPRWPEALRPPSGSEAARLAETRYQRGAVIFGEKCAGCHAIPDAKLDHYAVTMVALSGPEANRTDPWMACNAYTSNARTGQLNGIKEGYFSGRVLGPVEPTATLLATTVKGTLVSKKGQILKQAANTILGVNRPPVTVPQDFPDTSEGRRAARLQRCLTDKSELLAYKARPLDGIWATAPYLHNGSVPTLFDLLLPAAKRPTVFFTGTRQYDAQKVGYVTDKTAPGNSFKLDTKLQGNANVGHDYGTSGMNDEGRWSLIEYLKRL